MNSKMRFPLLALGCAFLVANAALPAAEPDSGTVSQIGDTLAWQGGPFTSANASTGTCVEGVSCDTFTLTLAIPDGKVARVNFEIHWQGSNNDFDLFVFDQQGNTRGSSAAGGTESEQVAISGLEAGIYKVVTNAFATVNTSYQGRITLENIRVPPPKEELRLSETLHFGDETIVDFGAGVGEPFIRSDNQGDIYVTGPFGLSTTISLLWKSYDGGRTYIPLGTPIVRDSVIAQGGGDSHLDFDANNNLYFVDLSGGCVTAAVSLDGGNTFPPERTNQVTCVSTENPDAIGDDRQWVGAFGDGIAYATWRNLLDGDFWLFKTSNAGLSWDEGHRLGSVGQSGPFQVDKEKRFVSLADGSTVRVGEAILSYQIYYRGTNLRVFRIADFNNGSPLVIDDFSIVDPGVSVSNVFPVLAIDRTGNLYVAWSQGATTIYMATSTDHGETWSEPVKVSTNAGTNIMPWIVAGDAGRVDIVWYHGSLKGNPNDPDNVWDIYMAQSLNALNETPAFQYAKVNQTFIHRGEICLRGLACTIEDSDRSFLEFPSVTVDARGAAVVTYNDNTNQGSYTYTMTSRQVSGHSLFESVGLIGADPGTVTIDAPAPGQSIEAPAEFTARGHHTLPPANFARDRAGDAHFPNHGPVIGASIPALDIRAVSVSTDADALIFTMEMADLSGLATAAVQSGGDGVAYVVQWEHQDVIHWAGAEVRGGVPVFWNGTIGSVATTLENPKYFTFRTQPTESLGVTGSIEGNTLTVRVPRAVIGSPADGERLFTVTGYALSQRGPFTPDTPDADTDRDTINLPIQVDASAAFTYTVGKTPARNGVVEVSMDDATFANAREARLVDVTGGGNRWEATLGKLAAGNHTLYVRQHITGRAPSPVESVDFEVPAFAEASVSELVRLLADNAAFSNGVANFDLALENTSATPIFTPLRAQVVALSSSSGNVTVNNADNGEPGAGAFWRYDDQVGGDGTLSPSETSGPRRLAFNDAAGEPFSVTLDVIGHLARGKSADAAATDADKSAETDGGGTGTKSLGELVFKITVNPLTGSVTIELVNAIL